MRAVIQRVSRASVSVDGERIGAIDRGFLVLVGFTGTDTEDVIRWMARKIISLRVFEDEDGKMNRDLRAVGGRVLVVSQFTLYGDCRKGKRPGFDKSAPPDAAATMYDFFVQVLRDEAGFEIEAGEFQAHMDVDLVNDGPVTFILDKEAE
ncbi:MAG: D-tyrosyl-tRNA(Tyr) deacylase [Candidatus Latescibacterota bacterium]|nr:MAG: D-tyrosyl-tRNA(Tyr) deacylase [Candidatus Latescibacterota bacterium]